MVASFRKKKWELFPTAHVAIGKDTACAGENIEEVCGEMDRTTAIVGEMHKIAVVRIR